MNAFREAVKGLQVCVAVHSVGAPKTLSAMLESLQPEIRNHGCWLIIAGSSDDVEKQALVDSFALRWLKTVYVAVPERDSGQARDLLIAACLKNGVDSEWVVMLNDDCLVREGWLQALVSAGRAQGLDLVGGPTAGVSPFSTHQFPLRSGVVMGARNLPVNEAPLLTGAHNIAVRSSVFKQLKPPLFQNDPAASGFEDYDFIRRLQRAKLRTGWSEKAHLQELRHADSPSIKQVIARYFAAGRGVARVDSKFDGISRVWIGSLKGLVRALGSALLALLRLNAAGACRGALVGIYYLGRVKYLLGGDYSRDTAFVVRRTTAGLNSQNP